MSTVAVAGASGTVGQAVLDLLSVAPGIDHVVSIDARPPPAALPANVRHVDASRADLTAHLHGCDAVVDLGGQWPSRSPREGADRSEALLRAALAAGVHALVVVTSTLAYGAHPDNPVPLQEDHPLRAPDGFEHGHRARVVDERVAAVARDHPEVRTVRLRAAPVLDDERDVALVHRLQSPLLTLVADHDPPVQLCDAEDLARAVVLALEDPSLQGAYNVAADGWLSVADLARIVGRPRMHLPEAVAMWLADGLSRWDVLPGGADWVRYLEHPVVVDTRRLAAAGWHPTRTNRDILRAFARRNADVWRVGPLPLSRSRLAWSAVTGAAVAAASVGVVAAAWAWRTWRSRRREAPA